MQFFRMVLLGLFVHLSLAHSSQAAVVSFNLGWNSEFGGPASAVGTISLDDALLPNPGSSFFGTASVVSFSITVSGSASNDGTYTLSDYSTFVWNTDGATLDLSQELFGQATSSGIWGVDKGDFNFFSTTGAPSSTTTFRLLIGVNPNYEILRLTNVTPISSAVPEPSSMAIFGLVAGVTGWRVRRNRSSV